jgi:hypothetical protein
VCPGACAKSPPAATRVTRAARGQVRKALEEQVKALEAEGKGGAPALGGAPPGRGAQGHIDFEQQTPDDQGMKF